MGILTGYISFVCFILLAAKYVARKTKNYKVDHFLKGLHKPVSCIFFISAVLHLFLVLPVLKGRSLPVTVSGSISIVFAILLVLLCHIIKNGQKKMFWHRMMTDALLVTIILHVITYYVDFAQYKNKIKETEIADVNIAAVPDGVYIGEYDVGYIYAKVQVTVADEKISDIEILKHRNERGSRAESIIEDILEEQRIDVDAVTSATNSSLVIEKACENALSGWYAINKK
ncbi:MAG: FMN-binding protein [Lachnospiraceae bacterium]